MTSTKAINYLTYSCALTLALALGACSMSVSLLPATLNTSQPKQPIPIINNPTGESGAASSAGACSSIANGATASRIMYAASNVSAGQTCISEVQSATCVNGTLGDYNGTYTNRNCFAGSSCASGRASSIQQHGITWTFDHSYTCGQYANGDYWVLGPVIITDIDPKPTDGQNGTVVNPRMGRNQGFDKDFTAGYNDYVSPLNVGKTLPLNAEVDSSVVSSITADGWLKHYTIQMHAILTVVQTRPAAASFRPAAVGLGSRASLWNESQLDYNKLRRLPRAQLSSVPSMAAYVQEHFQYPWLEYDPNWTGVYVRPEYMGRLGYGRSIADRTGDVALLLNLDFTDAEKRDLLVAYVQVAIDNYGFLQDGGVWYTDGGENIGRLSPIMLAGVVLNEQRFINVVVGSQMKFQEFQNTFFVTQADVDRKHVGSCTNGQVCVPYTSADIGMAEWGITHIRSPDQDNNYVGAWYRDINGGSYTSVTMAARCMGMRSTISWEPLFKYAERHIAYEYTSLWNYNPTPSFHREFYNEFRGVCP